MAKKKETITPEEKLAQALVPKDQQPYEPPKGWVWTRAKGIANVIMGQSPKGTETTDDSSQTPLIGGAADLDNLFPRPQKYTRQITKLSQPGDIIVCIRATLGKPVFSDKIYCLGRGVAAFRPLNIDKQYLRYYIINFEKYLYENATGSTFLSISSAQLANMPIPLPSLPEQQRIVARIESLFAKLDAAREKLQQVLDTQEARRAAILHEAFTGRLTGHGSEERRGKREEDGSPHLDEVEFVPEGWRKVKLSDVCTVNPPKIKTKGLDDSLEVSFYPMASVDEHTGTVTKPEKRTLGEVKRGYTNFIENDVVLAKITPCFENGKSAIIGPLLNHIGYGTTEFFVLRSAKDLYNKFLFYLVRSSKFRSEAKDHMTGAVGQQRVPKDFVEDYSFFLPPLEEQILIVDILDSLLDKEYRSFEIAQRLVSQIELLKKSILARAFRGELGTQDPSDPDARELLLEQ